MLSRGLVLSVALCAACGGSAFTEGDDPDAGQSPDLAAQAEGGPSAPQGEPSADGAPEAKAAPLDAAPEAKATARDAGVEASADAARPAEAGPSCDPARCPSCSSGSPTCEYGACQCCSATHVGYTNDAGQSATEAAVNCSNPAHGVVICLASLCPACSGPVACKSDPALDDVSVNACVCCPGGVCPD